MSDDLCRGVWLEIQTVELTTAFSAPTVAESTETGTGTGTTSPGTAPKEKEEPKKEEEAAAKGGMTSGATQPPTVPQPATDCPGAALDGTRVLLRAKGEDGGGSTRASVPLLLGPLAPNARDQYDELVKALDSGRAVTARLGAVHIPAKAHEVTLAYTAVRIRAKDASSR